MGPLGEVRVLAGTAPIALSPKALEEGTLWPPSSPFHWWYHPRVSSREEVRHDRTSHSALRPEPPLAPSPVGIRNPRTPTFPRSPSPHPALLRPLSRDAHSQNQGDSSPTAGERWASFLPHPSTWTRALHRPKTWETAASQLPSDEKINPSVSVAFLLLCFDRFHPAGTTSPSLCQGPHGGCPHPQWWSPSPMPETHKPLSL